MSTKTFDQALTDFIAATQKRDDERMMKDFAILCVNGRGNKFYPSANGRKFIRIVREDVRSGQRSVHCFVDATTGDILKDGGWKAPQPNGKRGSIYDADPLACMSDYGCKYIR
jgi:hypothetical protein